MNILGIATPGPGASAALFDNHNILAAIEEEKLSRTNDPHALPYLALANVLANFSNAKTEARETINGVDAVRVTGTVTADAVNKIAPQIAAGRLKKGFLERATQYVASEEELFRLLEVIRPQFAQRLLDIAKQAPLVLTVLLGNRFSLR